MELNTALMGFYSSTDPTWTCLASTREVHHVQDWIQKAQRCVHGSTLLKEPYVPCHDCCESCTNLKVFVRKSSVTQKAKKNLATMT